MQQDAGISAILQLICIILLNFHCACAKRPYFHFLSKIWCHHRVPPPRLPKRRENFGDSHAFKADIALLIAYLHEISGPLGLKWRFWGQNREKRGAILGFLRLCQTQKVSVKSWQSWSTVVSAVTLCSLILGGIRSQLTWYA